MIYALKPDRIFDSIQLIPIKLFETWNVKGIILDVDNTLLPRTANDINSEVVEWVEEIKKKFRVIIISNNSKKKIERVSIPLDLPYIPWAIKPLKIYFKMAEKRLELKPESICMIGDQLFTDIKGAKNDDAFKIELNESIFIRQIKIDFYVDMIDRIKELNLEIDEELKALRN